MPHMITRKDEMEALAESPVFRRLSPEEQLEVVEEVLDRYGGRMVESFSTNSREGGEQS